MTTFLDEVAEHLMTHHADELRDVVVVLPARRATLFLKKAIRERSAYEGWLPEFVTMTDLLVRMTEMPHADSTDLLFELFKCYREHFDQEASFNDFLQWGPTAMADFNEVDSHLLDATAVYKNLKDIKEIEAWSFGVEEAMWSDGQRTFAQFWEDLGKLYHVFHQRMNEQNSFFGGAIARKAAQDPIRGFERLGCKKVVVAGLNALSTAEHRVIKTLQDRDLLDFLWDADSYYVTDKSSEAGHFARLYKDLGKRRSLPAHFLRKKRILLTACSSSVAQSQYAGQVLSEYPTEDATNTAIVLPDNAALGSLLPAIPGNYDGINITMGRPLSEGPYRSLTHAFFQLIDGHSRRLRYNKLMPFLRHPFTGGRSSSIGKVFQYLSETVVRENAVMLDRKLIDEFLVSDSDASIKVRSFFNAVFDVLDERKPDKVLRALDQLQTITAPSEKDSKETQGGWELFCGLTGRIRRLLESHPVIEEVKEFERIYQRLFGQLRIDLVGEPLSGLQIMGLLESRSLDFKRLIILNANEGVLPRRLPQESFIPADLRHHLGLPSAQERDAYYAYYLYRLLQRAEEVHLVYNAGAEQFDVGEPSRYVQQIASCDVLERSEVEIIHLNVLTRTAESAPEIPPIATGAYTREQVEQQLQNGLSPSALNKWIDCPQEFFFRYILRLGEQDEVEEELENSTIGTVVHQVLEGILESFKGQALRADALKAKKQSVAELVDHELGRLYSLSLTRFGVNYLLKKVIHSFVNKLLDMSIAETEESEVLLLDLEARINRSLSPQITLKGSADRTDRVNGTLRVVDYKSGKVEPNDLKLKEDWPSQFREGKSPKALQTLIYAWIMGSQYPDDAPVAGIMSARAHSYGFMPVSDKEGQALALDTAFSESFEDWLKSCIEELRAGLSLVSHNSTSKYCSYCANLEA